MYNFKNDYNLIAHENILKAFIKYQDEANNGYGLDNHSLNAKSLIKKYINNIDVDIHFLVGGTIANKTVISHILRPYQAVISADTGHINVHETGAIEASGHKIILIPNYDGKIKPEDIRSCFKTHTDEHMVMPKMVYISESTEAGTVYTKEEIKAIYDLCKELGMYLFIDGARLGVAIDTGVVSIDDLAHYSDVFYIGGTKNGAPLGEAIVIVNDELKDYFRYSIKQNGGMYSKGFIAGICFEELFNDNLYFDLAHNSNECAKYLAKGLEKLGIGLKYPCITNQIFPVVSNALYEKLLDLVLFELWEDLGDKKVIRFVCNFSTKKEEIDKFLTDLGNLHE